VFLLAVPVPYTMVEGGWVPTLWVTALAGLVAAAAWADGGETTSTLAKLLLPQALGLLLACYLLARLTTWLVGRVLPRRLAAITLLLIAAACLAVAVAYDIFQTTAVRGGAPANLLAMLRLA
jgi:hypothetical protein